jgi:hypothetical protein
MPPSVGTSREQRLSFCRPLVTEQPCSVAGSPFLRQLRQEGAIPEKQMNFNKQRNVKQNPSLIMADI